MNAVELLYAAETDILIGIAERLGAGDVGAADWKIDRMRRLGALSEFSRSVIRKYRNAIMTETANEIDEAAFKAAISTEKAALEAKRRGARVNPVFPADIDPALLYSLDVWQKEAANQMNLAMAGLAEKAGSAYVEAVNKAAMAVIIGGQTPQAALVSSVREWSEEGLPNFVDKANRTWTTEAYASMVIRSNTRRVTTEVMFARGDQFGTDLIEVSSHAASRPGCAPYQGNIYSRTGKSEKYPPLSSTSYGEPAGLFGINCGHNAYPFFEGMSTKRFKPTDDEEQNAEDYKASQKQRGYERSIRSAKRELAAMQALGNESAVKVARGLVQDRQAALRAFIDDTGRVRRNGREQVYDKLPAAEVEQGPETVYKAPNDSGNIPLNINKVQKVRIPPEIKRQIIASGGINSPILKNWIRLNWM